MPKNTGLIGTNGTQIALKSVHIEGQIDGLLASMAITQRYRNNSGTKLEIMYTFPLAWGATLLGMDVTLGGKRLQGVVLGKKQAEARYESAIDDGDTPVIVEASALGLYTANLGNIEDGEYVTVELRYAQVLRYEHGSARLAVPCVIAPRYGDAHKDGGLAPHESAAHDLFAQYPLTIRIVLLGQAAKAAVHCPSHSCSVAKMENSTAILVNSGAMLDRDFILSLDSLKDQAFALMAPDGDGHMMLASFCPDIPTVPEPLRMKILVDCSGSMAGDSITQAREALNRVLLELEPADYISYSRFGDAVRHESDRLQPCSKDILHHCVGLLFDTRADMGGTEMEQALLSTLNDIAVPKGGSSSPCVLLITDGEIWNVERVVQASQASGNAFGQRIFVVGVGSAPAESLLRELAQKTGGACELVSPNENIVAAITRMVRKMRGTGASSPRIDWGAEPLWQSALPSHLYDGETVHVFASFAQAPPHTPALRWSTNGYEADCRPDAVTRTDNDAVTRLGGAARMAEAATTEEARDLALRYQLVSKHSTLFLVHTRDGVKTAGLPLLQQVPQMMAAGHGGLGSVRRATREGLGAGARPLMPIDDHREFIMPEFLRRSEAPAAPFKTDGTERKEPKERRIAEGESFELPLHSTRPELSSARPVGDSRREKLTYRDDIPDLEESPTPLALLQAFEEASHQYADGLLVADAVEKCVGDNALRFFLKYLSCEYSLPTALIWALLFDWLQNRFKDSFAFSEHAQKILQEALKTVQEETKNSVAKAMVRQFATATLEDWGF